ncbi:MULTISPECIES: alginate lyase family protein [unclassified Pseudomonas]|uniref:heparinase II/III family protein n=1 Tax=unclassified Pseudomonas TaxID=196821 RepID=UPI002B237FE9|nr:MULTISPECIES: alginate lyase family protein [unclassified Pseudomonas]MEB0200013.1 alginate lyase family protein [Pseudomonas sp. 5S4]MEB0246588.1 alginate lyase family protein [Pseudomonas sp. 10S5]
MSRLLKFYYTVKMLRSKQIFYRIYYRFFKVSPFTSTGFSKRDLFSLSAVPKWNASRYLANGEFNFMGIQGPVEWDNTNLPKIWLYNLHYLDNLASSDEDVSAAGDLVNSWISGNPPFVGIGWEPYPLSLRIVNLIKWFQRQSTLQARWLDSLAAQTHALSEQVEYHILANHLFVNGKALVIAGCFMEGTQAESWQALGLKILDAEVSEQFLADGAHFELSPMYHASLLWDMCDLVNLALHTPLAPLRSRLVRWQQVVKLGILWLRSIQHPDGGIPFFNDAAFGIAPTLNDLEGYARLIGCLPDDSDSDRSSVSMRCHIESGYAVMDFGDSCKALLNFAQIAPDYQPGHSHADTLSFELSLFGQRIFVNSGTSQYGEDSERKRQRSTAAHNTVEVDGQNSSEVWAGFRVARRARAMLDTFESSADSARISCHHDGYVRLKGKNLHAREWLGKVGELQVTDRLTGVFGQAVARLFVHPEVRVVQNGENLIATLPRGEVVSICIGGASSINLVDSTWHPEFGKSVSNKCIIAGLSSETLTTTISW